MGRPSLSPENVGVLTSVPEICCCSRAGLTLHQALNKTVGCAEIKDTVSALEVTGTAVTKVPLDDTCPFLTLKLTFDTGNVTVSSAVGFTVLSFGGCRIPQGSPSASCYLRIFSVQPVPEAGLTVPGAEIRGVLSEPLAT